MQTFFHNYMDNYIQIQFSGVNATNVELLIALLSEAGFDGFEEADQQLDAYIPEQDYDPSILKQLPESLYNSSTMTVIPPRNWNEEWEQHYQPVTVDDFVSIRAHFHAPIPAMQYEIVITPKMSFGTGHHATTWQMMKHMQTMDLFEKKVFDFGTGTGVLAILAEKCGAAAVLAVDYDDWCIENTTENLERNRSQKIIIQKGDAPPSNETFDVILANINRHILLQNMKQLADVLRSEGFLLISGFYVDENPLLVEAAQSEGLQLVKATERQNWSALLFQKKSEK